MLHYCYIKNCYCFSTTFFPLSIELFGVSYLLVFLEILQIDRNIETEKSDIVDFPEQLLFALIRMKNQLNSKETKVSFPHPSCEAL